MFDQNPACLLSTVVDKLVWETQVRKTCNEELKRQLDFFFFRTNVKILRNYSMNDADISDQHRGNYQLCLWCRTNKWWISLWF